MGEAGFCGNFIDDDGDGLADCADPECAFTIDCAGIGANLGLQFVPGNMEIAFGYWPFTMEDMDGDPTNGAETMTTRIIWDNLALMPAGPQDPMDIPELTNGCQNLNGAPTPAFPGLFGIDVQMDTPLQVLLNQIVTDPDDDNMTVTFGPGSDGGTLTLSNGNYVYLPPTGFTGIETFSFTATDPHGGETSGVLSFDVSEQP